MIVKVDGQYYDVHATTGDPILMDGCPDLDVKWQVLRQDRRGNKIKIATGLEKLSAEKIIAEFALKRNKQLYWMETEE
jgi:hypothetical protein